MNDTELARQHLIDPEICIRCNTCEETCPVDAITHDGRNYVVNFDICNGCNDCISPCPTGSIDNWRIVEKSRPFSLEEQLSWDTLPAETALVIPTTANLPEEVARLTAAASAGQGGTAMAPWSAAQPSISLFAPDKPAIATVSDRLL